MSLRITQIKTMMENNFKGFATTVIVLTLTTFVALAYYHLGFNRTLNPINNADFSVRVNTDQDHGGLTRGRVVSTPEGYLKLTCDISHLYKHPFCEISFDYKPTGGTDEYLDLSVYDEVMFDVHYSGVSAPRSRFIIRNVDPAYSRNDLQSDKFNLFEFNTDNYGHDNPLSLSYLYVPKWWTDYYRHPVTLTAVDISKAATIEIGTEELVAEGQSVFEIRAIEFRGKVFPLSDYLTIIIAIWIITLFGQIIVNLWQMRERLIFERKHQKALKDRLDVLQKEVSLDPLTGLRNRHELRDLFVAIERLCQQGTPVSVSIFDIDHFKQINDSYGHGVGDDVLRKVSDLLVNISRDNDVLIRWGGEEFVVIRVGENVTQATIFFERVRMEFEQTQWPQHIDVTASFGVVEVEQEYIEHAIQRADELLYAAKANGRNCVLNGK